MTMLCRNRMAIPQRKRRLIQLIQNGASIKVFSLKSCSKKGVVEIKIKESCDSKRESTEIGHEVKVVNSVTVKSKGLQGFGRNCFKAPSPSSM